MDGDLIDYEDDGYVAPNMSYVPEGLDEHEISSASAVEGSKNEEDLLKEGEGEEAEAGDDSFEVSGRYVHGNILTYRVTILVGQDLDLGSFAILPGR